MDSQLLQAIVAGNVQATATCIATHAVDVNQANPDGDTPLHFAARLGHRGVSIQLHVAARAALEHQNHQGFKPWDLAKHAGFGDMVGLLAPPASLALKIHAQSPDEACEAPDVRQRCFGVTASSDAFSVGGSSQAHSVSRPRSRGESVSTSSKASNRVDLSRDARAPEDSLLPVVAQQLQRLGLFQADPEQFVRPFLSYMSAIPLYAGDDIYCQHDPSNGLFVLVSGEYQMTKSRARRHTTLYMHPFKAPAMVGDLEVIYDCTRTLGIRCLEDGMAIHMPATVFAVFLKACDLPNARVSIMLSELRAHALLDPYTDSSVTRSSSPGNSMSPSTHSSTSPSRKVINFFKGGHRRRGSSEPPVVNQNHVGHMPEPGSGTATRKSRLRSNSAASHQGKKEHKRGSYRRRRAGALSRVVAGTVKQLIKVLLVQSCYDDDDYVRDFFMCYRQFATPEEVAGALFAYQMDHPEAYDTVARLFVAWAVGCAHPDKATDMEFAADQKLYDSAVLYAEDLPDQSVHKKALFRNLKRPEESSTCRAEEPAQQHLLVKITKLGGHRDDKVFAVQPHWTLASVKEQVCCDDTARANSYMLVSQPYREFSGGKLMSIMASSYQFRAFGFALPLPESTMVADACLTTVLLVPERAAGLHLAQELDINFVADVLTKLDHDDFADINPTHLLKERWRQDGPKAPLARILKRYQQVSDWIITMVLTEEEVGERARIVEMLIELADKFVDLQNLHGTIAVVAALAHGSVKRLKRTWALVPRPSFQLFEVLSKLLDPHNNRFIYRQKLHAVDKVVADKHDPMRLRKCKAPCMPFVGCFSSDILFHDERNPDTLKAYEAKGMSTPGCSDDELELVNFFKHRGLSRIMEQVREYQRSRYTSKQVPLATAINLKYTTWFLNTFDRLPEAQRFQFSKMLEPLSTSGEEQLPEPSIGQDPARITNWKSNPSLLEDIVSAPGGHYASSSSTSRDPSHVPRIRYLNFFSIEDKEPRYIMRTMQAFRDNAPADDVTLVTAQVVDDVLFVLVPETHALVLKRPLRDIDDYVLDHDNGLLYIYSVSKQGRRECHFFEIWNETSSDIFALIRKNCRRFEKEQNKTSLENRQRAVAKLTDMEHPVADGAFVLRDSTSQPGCFALSLKQGCEIIHYLIERLVDDSVSFKDSALAFDSLRDLIVYYCLDRVELPCLLNPTDSEFLTEACPRFASNSLPLANGSSTKTLESEPWFFGSIGRVEAQALLERFQRVGMFLVRASSIDKDSYALSYLHSTGASGYVMHVLISYNHKTKMYQLDEQDCAPTVSQVIACCSQPDQAWLPSPLVMSCPQLGTLAKPMSQMLVAESSDGSQRVVRLPGAAGAKTRMASSDVLSGSPDPKADWKHLRHKVVGFLTRKKPSSPEVIMPSPVERRISGDSRDTGISRASSHGSGFYSPSSSGSTADTSDSGGGCSLVHDIVISETEPMAGVLKMPIPHARFAAVVQETEPALKESQLTLKSHSTSTVASSCTALGRSERDADRERHDKTPSADAPSTSVADLARYARLSVETRRNSIDSSNTAVPSHMLKRLELCHTSSGATLFGSEQPASGQQTPTGSIHDELDNGGTSTPTTSNPTTVTFCSSSLRVSSTLV